MAAPLRTVHLHPDAETSLVADVVEASAPDRPTWLFLHGFGSHRGGEKARAVLRWAAERGDGAVSIDQRYHGDSSGSIEDIRLEPMVEDARFVFRALRDGLAGSRGPVGLFGSSLCGLVGTHAAARAARAGAPAPDVCVLIAPAFGWLERLRARPRDDDGQIVIGNEWLQVRIHPEAAEAHGLDDEHTVVAAVRTPTVIFHGTADDTVPVEASRSLAPCFGRPAEVVEIDGGGHRLSDDVPRILAAAARLATDHLGADPSAPDGT